MDKNPNSFNREKPPSQSLVRAFRTPPLPCPYLDDRVESRIAIDLSGPDASGHYAHLSQAGFRRTGQFAYRPNCPGCTACVSVRILAREFSLNRGQRRIQATNAQLTASEQPQATEEQFQLFRRYQLARHGSGDMARMDFSDYRAIVEEGIAETQLIEFRKEDGTLVLVGLVDWLGDGPSAVYSFFDPDESRRSLGSFLILWLVEQARALDLPYVYLGYWIAESRKMTYKARFRPLEGFGESGWQRLDI